jgi:hypothetical protein
MQFICRSPQLLDINKGSKLFDPNTDFAMQQYWCQRNQQVMDILVQTMDLKNLPPLLEVRSSQ